MYLGYRTLTFYAGVTIYAESVYIGSHTLNLDDISRSRSLWRIRPWISPFGKITSRRKSPYWPGQSVCGDLAFDDALACGVLLGNSGPTQIYYINNQDHRRGFFFTCQPSRTLGASGISSTTLTLLSCSSPRTHVSSAPDSSTSYFFQHLFPFHRRCCSRPVP